MCGILALMGSWEGSDPDRMLDRMAHRGPDGRKSWSAPGDIALWLGHRRLAINDLSDAGAQPMVLSDGPVALVCNGEIYNAPALRSELEVLGHRFGSQSDNEVILHGYRQWGDAVIDRLEGMFAFVLWDGRRRRLLAARDRLGIKPLYWTARDGCLALASEARALAPLTGQRIDPLACAYILSLGYVPAPHSPYQGISKLPAGHLLVAGPDEPARLRPYWSPPRELAAEKAEPWDTLFEKVVNGHLLSDVPVGLFLSGGLDSVSLALALHRIGVTPVAYTMCHSGMADPDADLAARVAAALRLPHRMEPMEGWPDLASLPDLLGRFDEPQGYSALLTMERICRPAASHHKVVLSGDGGDEVLGGYRWYNNLAMPPASQPLSGDPYSDFARRSLLHRHAMRLFPRFLPQEVEALLAPLGVRFDEEAMLAPLEAAYVPALPPRRALQRVDLMTFCADSILNKVDQASMAHALEVRVPFLDHRLVEWGLSRPLEPEGEETGKPVLRRYLTGAVPVAVLNQPKTGFSLKSGNPPGEMESLDRIGRGPLHSLLASDYRHLMTACPGNRAARTWILTALAAWMEGNRPIPIPSGGMRMA